MDVGLIPIGMDGDKFIFYAADESAVKFGKKHTGEIIAASVRAKYPRDAKAHNQFHAVLDRAVSSLPMYEPTDWREQEIAHEDLMIKLKYATGFVTFIEKLSGERQPVPRSEAYDSDATQEEIYAFYDAAYGVLCTLLDCTIRELLSPDTCA